MTGSSLVAQGDSAFDRAKQASDNRADAQPHSVARVFTDRLQVRCPPALPEAITVAASRQMMTPSEYVRRSVIDRLRADGFIPGVA
jgi:hypothetical protein